MSVNALHAVCRDSLIDKPDAEVEALIRRGWDVNALDKYGATPLHYALSQCHFSAAKLLVASGADVNARGKNICPPIFIATRLSAEMVSVLVQAGANVNFQGSAGLTPLIVASLPKVNGATRFLMEGFYPDWSSDECDGTDDSKPEIVEILIAAGAAVSVGNCNRRTPLHFAARGQGKVLALLLDAGSDPSALDSDGHSPLHYARTSRIAEALIRAGAHVDKDALLNPCVVKADARMQQRLLARTPAAARSRRRA